MNRQTKRMSDQGANVSALEVQAPPPEPELVPAERGRRQRNDVVEFLRGVRSELRKVVWPDRTELTNYSVVVFVTLVILLFFIFFLNWAFGHAVGWLLGT